MSESQGRGTPVRAQDDSTSSESQNILESLNIETAVLPKGRRALCQLSAWDGPGVEKDRTGGQTHLGVSMVLT